MANICNFTGKLVGKKKEVKKVFRYFTEEYSYNFFNFDKIAKKTLELEKEVGLDLQNLIIKSSNGLFEFMLELVKLEKYPNASREEIIELYNEYTKNKLEDIYAMYSAMGKDGPSNKITLEEAEELRRKEVEKVRKNLDYDKFKEIIKEGLVTKFLPKKPHFLGIYEVDIISESEKPDGKYSISFSGSCAWSLLYSMSIYGAQKQWTKYKGTKWFKGISFEEVHEKFPDLKMEVFSEESGMGFSEHLLMTENLVYIDEEDFEETCYESVEEAKEDGIDITEDMVGEWLYTVLPSWFERIEEGKFNGYSFDFTI